MFKAKLVYLLGFSFLILSGCRLDVRGPLIIDEPFVIRHEVLEGSGDSKEWVIKETPLKRQNTEASIQLRGCCEIILTLKPGSSRRKVYQMTVSNQIQLPENGPFILPARSIGQKFDIKGKLTTHKNQSEVRQKYISCQYQDTETVCEPGRGCYSRPVWKNGIQFIEYYEIFYTYLMEAKFVDAYSQSEVSELARFNGTQEQIETIIQHRGPCH